jgi:mono/diheme cytochrome c family protein
MAHTAWAGGAAARCAVRVVVLLALMFAAGDVFSLADTPASSKSEKVDYNRQIRPIFADRCFVCHGPDAAKRQADLRFDAPSDGLKKVLSPGNSAGSELVRRVSSNDPDERMPPSDSKKPRLTPEQIGLIRRWIDQGAKYEIHWAYVRPTRPSVAAAGDRTWQINMVDCFIAQGHAQHGLKPAAEADRRTLLRRLSLDLIGLPPTPAEIAAFLADSSPNAYEKQVDRLLASPHFGERMAVYWLDLVRYGDTCGYHSDNHRDVWLFRDWVIDAFNKNLPFDRFTIEQLAGDLMPGASREQRIASGYNRLLMTTEEGGAQPKEYEVKFVADRVRNTASAWLGVTMGCSQCHDHKYDPFTTRDFYSFGAFFADVKELAVGRQVQSPMPTAEQAARLKQFDEEIAALGAGLPTPPAERPKVSQSAKEASGPSDRRGQETRAEREKLGQLKREREAFEKTIPTTLVSEAVPPRVVRILRRGNWLDDSGEIVAPAIPAFLGKLETGGRRASRLDLARWFLSPDNPLVARVFVNRLWKQFFGQGIVKTLDDCGTQGAAPTYPELLDWLAVEFRESGWDVKRLVRLLVTSRTYRQSSEGSKETRQHDPANLWLARQGRFRLDAEFVRDNALAISGLLTRKIGGPSVKPYQPAGYWSFLNFPPRDWAADLGENQYRRGLYTYWQRTFVHPSLLAFDASTREECVAERARSNTPLQSLALLNDPTYVEAARAFAQRMIREGGPTPPQRLQFAYETAVGRPPQPAEARLLVVLFEKHRKHYASDEKSARALVEAGQSKPPGDIPAAELAACTSVARIILNLHETITRN